MIRRLCTTLALAGALLLASCQTTGGISDQNKIDFSTGAVALDASFKSVISICITAVTPLPQCASAKGQIKAASQAATSLFDTGDSLIDSGGSASGLTTILTSLVADLVAYEQIVTDLNQKQALALHKKKISVTDIITILQIGIPVISQIFVAVENAINGGAPSVPTIDANVQQLNADNATIQTW